MKKRIVILLFLINVLGFSQNINLIPNYSFEDTTGCYIGGGGNFQYLKNWYNPTQCSPDFYDRCTDAFNSSAIFQVKRHSGYGRIGMIIYDSVNPDVNVKEYIASKFNYTLKTGKKYCFDLYVISGENVKFGSDKFGAYFGTGTQNYNVACGVIPVSPQINLPTGTMISDTAHWYHFIGTYTASGGESDIVIGSFSTDAQTNFQVIDTSLSAITFSYFVIDDISLHEMFLNMGNDTTICSGVDFTIGEENLDTAFKSYYWYHNGVLFDSIVSQKTINLTAPDSFVLEKRFACGSVFDTIHLNVSTTVCLVKPLAISNANIFSPNNDGINDVFELQLSGSKFELKSFEIFDRWGLLVYEQNISALKNTDTPDAQNTKQTIYLQWNGRTTSGETCNDGIYYYTLQAENEKGETVKQRGFVSLVR